ncbi:MAG: hypothetical protein PVSMB7_06750 [Chloroflexota bacterium]
MIPSTCVVVPTYWTRSSQESRDGDAVYDHPTPVNGESTLRALLKSLEALDTSTFYLLVLVSVTGPDVAADAEAAVSALAGEFPSLQTIVFGSTGLKHVHERLVAHDLAYATDFLNLSHYPKIRNLQLAIPLILQSDAIVAVDDDEIVTDPDFIHKAIEPLGQQLDDKTIDGLSGYYLQDDGGILLGIDPQKASSPNMYDRKASIMNAATQKLEEQHGNIVPTPFCFGGNMEFTADLAAGVGFDPRITRGEDIDYLINARLEGKNFFMRKDLRILHCPPEGGSYKDASWSKLEQDVIRFAYEREKVRASQNDPSLQPVTLEELMPYPGQFLSPESDRDGESALRAAHYPKDVDSFLGWIRSSVGSWVDEYLQFRKQWPEVTARLRSDTELRDRLLEQVKS